MNKHQVVIVGDNHHNALGLVRSFGVNGIKPIGFIVCEEKKESFVTKSKYWSKAYILESYEYLIDKLIEIFSNEQNQPVLIPCSDTAGELLDQNLDKLSPIFIVPSIGERQGAITELMDKEKQTEFASKHSIPMAETRVLHWDTWVEETKEVTFPCIVKPVSSYEGKKSDIRKCVNEEELKLCLKEIFGEKHYRRILVQKFLTFDYELELVGSIHGDVDSFILTKAYRGWPVVGGTNSFFGGSNCKADRKFADYMMDILRSINYSGMFDIELFNIDGNIYLNEINWRNTGNSFAALGTHVHYAVTWYLTVIGEDSKALKRYCFDQNQFMMNEATDLRHVVFNKYPFKKWNADRKKTRSFSLWFKGDNKPTWKRYCYLFRKMIACKNGLER